MDSTASASDMSAIWAALQAADDGLPPRPPPPPKSYSFPNDDEDDDDEDDTGDDDDMAPVAPPRGGPGLLPQSFYSAATSGLPEVNMQAFLLPARDVVAPGVATAATGTSEMFLDDILRSPIAGAIEQPRLTAERLSQLEDNYERKKKRAKINRRDLNSRFQELMDLLKLKEDRKLNRAKVLEKAIEQIHKLTDELRTARQQLQRTNHAGVTPSFHAPPPTSMPLSMPLPMPQWSAGANMAAPMMWMPMLPTPPPVTGRPASARSRSASAKTARASAATATTPTSIPTASTTTASIQTQTSPEKLSQPVTIVRRPGLKRARDTPALLPTATLVWIAQEVPTLLELCDAWTLRELQCVSRDMHAVSRRDALWRRLCARRWRLDTVATDNALVLWRQLDATNERPHSLHLASTAFAFASGRRAGVGLWVALVRRSNGRTTRAVLLNGKAVVRQVVELHVLVQNLDPCQSLKLTNDVRVLAPEPHAFALITCDTRAHLAPHLVTLNDTPSAARVTDVELFHNDVCVLSVCVACDGLDLEQQFLDRVDGLEMQITRQRRQADKTTITIAATAHAHKHAQIVEAYRWFTNAANATDTKSV